MIELQDGMLLYHGSYIGIPAIDLNRCFGGLDFGRGFYLTSSYEQAYNYVQLSVRKAMRIGTVPKDFNPEDGQISVYKFHYDPNILAYCFQGASVEWLQLVAANRKKDVFPHLLKKYGTIDIIGGKIADDQTAHTLQQYIGGVDFGIPGTPKADKIAIEKLLPNRLKDQFCFRTQDAVKHLEYIRSDRYGEIKL